MLFLYSLCRNLKKHKRLFYILIYLLYMSFNKTLNLFSLYKSFYIFFYTLRLSMLLNVVKLSSCKFFDISRLVDFYFFYYKSFNFKFIRCINLNKWFTFLSKYLKNLSFDLDKSIYVSIFFKNINFKLSWLNKYYINQFNKYIFRLYNNIDDNEFFSLMLLNSLNNVDNQSYDLSLLEDFNNNSNNSSRIILEPDLLKIRSYTWDEMLAANFDDLQILYSKGSDIGFLDSHLDLHSSYTFNHHLFDCKFKNMTELGYIHVIEQLESGGDYFPIQDSIDPYVRHTVPTTYNLIETLCYYDYHHRLINSCMFDYLKVNSKFKYSDIFFLNTDYKLNNFLFDRKYKTALITKIHYDLIIKDNDLGTDDMFGSFYRFDKDLFIDSGNIMPKSHLLSVYNMNKFFDVSPERSFILNKFIKFFNKFKFYRKIKATFIKLKKRVHVILFGPVLANSIDSHKFKKQLAFPGHNIYSFIESKLIRNDSYSEDINVLTNFDEFGGIVFDSLYHNDNWSKNNGYGYTYEFISFEESPVLTQATDGADDSGFDSETPKFANNLLYTVFSFDYIAYWYDMFRNMIFSNMDLTDDFLHLKRAANNDYLDHEYIDHYNFPTSLTDMERIYICFENVSLYWDSLLYKTLVSFDEFFLYAFNFSTFSNSNPFHLNYDKLNYHEMFEDFKFELYFKYLVSPINLTYSHFLFWNYMRNYSYQFSSSLTFRLYFNKTLYIKFFENSSFVWIFDYFCSLFNGSNFFIILFYYLLVFKYAIVYCLIFILSIFFYTFVLLLFGYNFSNLDILDYFFFVSDLDSFLVDIDINSILYLFVIIFVFLFVLISFLYKHYLYVLFEFKWYVSLIFLVNFVFLFINFFAVLFYLLPFLIFLLVKLVFLFYVFNFFFDVSAFFYGNDLDNLFQSFYRE